MSGAFDAWAEQARAVPIQREIERRGIKLSGAVDRCGPCPNCGGTDRFSINTKKEIWNCRGCNVGGDVIALVQHLDGVDFIGACKTLAGEPPPKNIVAEEYRYDREDGDLAFVVERVEFQGADGTYQLAKDGKRKKSFRQRRPDPKKPGGWIWNIDGVPLLLYRLPELIKALANERPIVVVEGERKADQLWSLNVPATCNAGGAKKWKAEHTEPLAGANVILLPDNDAPGRNHVDVVAASLVGTAASIRVLNLPGLKPKGDVVDWVKGGGTVEELHRLMEQEAKFWTPPETDPDAPRSPSNSDDVLALEFAARHGADARYIAHRGKWFFWTSSVWLIDETLRAFDYARGICRDIAADCDAPRLAAALASAKTVAAVERLAKADRRIAASTDQWDTDAWIINAKTMTVDLGTGIDREPRREDYCTKSTGVSPAPPGTACPLWMAFLSRVTNNDPELIAFLKRLLGYCLTGQVQEQVLAFLFGTGANGKSVFVSTVTGILADYAIVAPMETFIASNMDRHPTEIAKFMGARLVVAQETQKGRRWDEAKIKNLTGGDKLTGRFMRGDFFDFKPTHKLLISGNHKPSLRNVDEAIRRRFLLVPFTVQIPENERDPRLAEKLKTEWPAIFRFMIEGCLEWRRDGLMVPSVVRKATDEYLADNDVVAQWLEELIMDGGPAAFTATAELFASWRRWCETRNYQPGTERAFSDSLSDRGYDRDRKNSARGFSGIALKQSSMLAEG